MKPTTFAEANGTLTGGPAYRYGTDLDVADLQVYRGGGQIISCWELSFWDRVRCAIFGKVWLRVCASGTHSPVCLESEYPFARQALDQVA